MQVESFFFLTLLFFSPLMHSLCSNSSGIQGKVATLVSMISLKIWEGTNPYLEDMELKKKKKKREGNVITM